MEGKQIKKFAIITLIITIDGKNSYYSENFQPQSKISERKAELEKSAIQIVLHLYFIFILP